MKIINAKVDDPGRKGYANSPRLDVWVDDNLTPTGTIVQKFTRDKTGYFLYQYHGPFVKYLFYYVDEKRNTGALGGEAGWPAGAWSSRAGAFNAEIGTSNPHLVDVSVYTPRYPDTGAMWALELDRAQSALKKFDPEWRLGLDEQAALRGDILWTPEEFIPSCLFQLEDGSGACLEVAYEPYMGRPMGACNDHIVTINRQAAQRRAATAARQAARR